MSEYGMDVPSPSPAPPPLKNISSGLQKSFLQLIVTAMALTAALAWGTAVQSLFQRGGALYRVTGGGEGNAGVWWAAVATTIIAFLVTAVLASMYPGEDTTDLQKAAGGIRVR
jgi:hypothetical protein